MTMIEPAVQVPVAANPAGAATCNSDAPRCVRHGGHRLATRPLLVCALLSLVLGVLAWIVVTYWVPVHGGTDQNGYLVTARLLAENKRLHVVPPDPFVFVGNMMIQTDDGRVFAKYPAGFPLLAAIGRILSTSKGMYWVNPLCTVLACLAAFFLFRLLLNDFAALLGVLWLACNPIVLCYANDSNSHASTLLCTTFGALGLLNWLQGKATWRGVIGAFALGYAATIRYTEVLLVLPVLFAAIARYRSEPKSIRQAILVLLAWALPVAVLAVVCWVSFGAPWKTGYSYCAEDTGFAWKYFWGDAERNRQAHWQTLLVQMNWMGLFILWPMGLIGMIGLLAERPRLAVAMLLWAAPPVVLYLFYYWAPEGETSLGYLRFFVSVVPALILAALWLVQRGLRARHWTGALSLGVVTAIGCLVNLANILPSLETAFYRKSALLEASTFVQKHVPQNSVLLIGDDEFSNHLDALGGYTIYNLQLFTNGGFGNLNRLVEDKDRQFEPDPRQRARSQLYLNVLSKTGAWGNRVPRSNDELRQAECAILDQYFHAGKRVVVLLRTGQNRDLVPQRSGWRIKLLATQEVYPAPTVRSRPVGGWNLQGRGSLEASRPGRAVTWSLIEVSPS